MNTGMKKRKSSKQAEHGKPASGIIDICIVENSLWQKNVEVDLLKHGFNSMAIFT